MFSLDNNNQYIDWWHEPVPGSGEGFDHEGTLTTTLLSPSVTIGLSNYWNINITQLLGTRTMTWDGDSPTKHHRDENSLSDFINATGGVLGDTRLLIRYLAYNDGQGEGKRLFLGGGMVFPSKNTITSDPFFLNGEHETDHRHFSISEGVQKGVFELQYYKKRNTNPVFIGGSITAELPTGKNKYGYQGSQMFETSLVVLSQMIKKIKTSIGGNFSVRHTTQAYWNNKKAPNSRATIISPGVSFLWNIKKGSFALGIQKPTFVSGGMSGTEAENLKQKINAWQISLSYRRVLDFVIPWIDPLGDL